MQVLREGNLKVAQNGILVNNEEEMRTHGETFIQNNLKKIIQSGLIILLNAELGAGKTQFVKGIAKELGIEEIVKSPTYSIIEEYETPNGKLIHIDTWRLTNISELKQLSIDKLFTKGNVIAVEWSAGVEDYLSKIAEDKGLKIAKIDIAYIDADKRSLLIWE